MNLACKKLYLSACGTISVPVLASFIKPGLTHLRIYPEHIHLSKTLLEKPTFKCIHTPAFTAPDEWMGVVLCLCMCWCRPQVTMNDVISAERVFGTLGHVAATETPRCRLLLLLEESRWEPNARAGATASLYQLLLTRLDLDYVWYSTASRMSGFFRAFWLRKTLASTHVCACLCVAVRHDLAPRSQWN